MSDRARVVTWVALALSGAGLLVLLAGGPGTRLGLWHFRTGLGLMRWAVFLGAAGLLAGLGALFVAAAPRPWAVAAVLLGLVAVGVPVQFLRMVKAVPAIHDVGTDPVDPPRFVDVLPLRGDGSNPVDGPGPDVVRQQRAAYPDLASLVVPAPPAAVFERALGTAREMGWAIVGSDAAAGRIEATDTTFWYGFKDDVVVRLRAEGTGTRVDVRSVSRVGVSDVGTNARRIRTYLERLGGREHWRP